MQTRLLGSAYYFLLFINDCTRFTWVYFLKKKSNTFEYFKEFRSMVEKQTSKCIRILCSDQGGEYKKAYVLKYYKDNGIDDPDLNKNTINYRDNHKHRDAAEITLHFMNVKY